MKNKPDDLKTALDTIIWDRQKNQGNPKLRSCNADCYGHVHTDAVLAMRLKSEPMVMPGGLRDARAFLLARELLNSEQLGTPTIRTVRAVAADNDLLYLWRPGVLAWLEAHPQYAAEDLVAQTLLIQYVRALH